MGLVPDDDEDIIVRNPNFIGPAEWDFRTPPWSYVPQHAQMSSPGLPNNFMAQFNFPAIPGNTYRMGFTLSNVALNNPAVTWLEVGISSKHYGHFNTNGVKSIDIICEFETEVLFFEMHNPVNGDFLDMDAITVVRLGNYVQDVQQIQTASGTKHEFYTASKSDFMQVMGNSSDHTGIWVAYNFP